MTRSMLAAVLLAAVCVGFVGCNSGTPEVKTVNLPEPNPLDEAKNILTNYSNGSPMTSEAASFPDLIKRVKAKDAAKGEILEKGLDEIKANPSSAKAKSTELLKKL